MRNPEEIFQENKRRAVHVEKWKLRLSTRKNTTKTVFFQLCPERSRYFPVVVPHTRRQRQLILSWAHVWKNTAVLFCSSTSGSFPVDSIRLKKWYFPETNQENWQLLSAKSSTQYLLAYPVKFMGRTLFYERGEELSLIRINLNHQPLIWRI